ncbi:MAG TPA: DUF2512 family protein [Bacillota bacterium]|nr:DUF2512 family protein [Bacillota bacterium]
MNTYFQALLVKVSTALAVSGALLLTADVSPAAALLISLAMTMVTFLAADIPFVPLLGAKPAVAVDVAVALPLLWGTARYLAGVDLTLSHLFILAFIIAAGEWLFHTFADGTGLYRTIRKHLKD